ncbi:MAG: tetratricopeptide repeat protein [Gemmatimonadaceae bacterium]
MSWWSRLLGGKSEKELSSRRVDYLTEALALERQGDFDAALTSYRLALRDHPNDPKILQNIAIAYSRTGRLEEAVRSYRRALEIAPELSGAHYGLAFLLLKRGDPAGALSHLDAFLARPRDTAEMEQYVRHAQQTVAALRAGSTDVATDPTPPTTPGSPPPRGA